jgi:photosystem II stability/assembly factor-like uncharacterized protein
MRLLLLAALALPAAAQYTLYTCAAITREYVVGAKLPPSGIFRLAPSGWQHAGYNHPFAFGLDYDRRDPSTLYIASGNGLIRASEHGEKWKILTGSDVTELRDVAVDPNSPGTIYFAHCAGIRVTHDSGVTWRELTGSLRRHYTEAIRVDRRRSGLLIAGTEQGLFRSEDGGETWKLAGASGISIMRIAQSPHDPCHWLAVTQLGGLFASHDCGVTFENSGNLGVGRNLYDIAFDPTTPGRIAIAGWGPGVAVSQDAGNSWTLRNAGLPRPDVWSVVFDPAHAGRLYASVQEEALYVSDDAGSHWSKAGLEGSQIPRMQFVPEVAK